MRNKARKPAVPRASVADYISARIEGGLSEAPRIGIVTSSLRAPLGGAELYAIRAAQWLAASGVVVRLFVTDISGDIGELLLRSGVAVTRIPSLRPYRPDRPGPRSLKALFHALDLADLVTPWRIRRALIEFGADSVHLHRFQGIGSLIFPFCPVPMVHTVHDYALVDTTATSARPGATSWRPNLLQRFRAAAIRFVLVRSRCTLVFPSEATRNRHHLFGLTPRIPAVTIPHGWDLPPVAPEVGRAPSAAFTFLFLGKVAAHKGIELLLDAWGPGIAGSRLLIAGDGPAAAKVAASSGESVTYLGWVDGPEKAALLRAVDVLVAPSLWPENFPLAVAEALISGTPVISTNLARPPGVIDGQTGLLVDPRSSELRAAMVAIAGDPVLARRLSAGARTWALGSLDIDLHYSRLGGLLTFSHHRASSTVDRQRT